jgi:uncharacterized protein YkwD
MNLRSFVAAAALFALLSLASAQDKNEPEFKLSKDEQDLVDATNAARAKMKLPPLKVNPILTKVARAHSANMAKQKKLDHKLDGKLPDERVDDAGYDYAKCNENVGWWPNTKAGQLTDGFMNSEVHRKNILGDFEEIGVGWAPGPKPVSGEKGFYATEVFGTLRKKQ